jgi:endonuclease/exonuclease/phosphatase family metal-dependent hydrolase
MTGNPELHLATWNIHMGVGRDGKRDLARTARAIRQMDLHLIGMQEVDNHLGEGGDDLELLGELTGMAVVAGPTMQHKRGDYGNALLTSLPVHNIERFDLSVEHREPRGLLIAHQDWQGGTLQVAVTHLGLRPGERRQQVRRLIECLSAEQRKPLILMGDFNEWLFWGRPMRWLRDHFGSVPSPRTFPSRCPLLRLDHILVDPPERLHALQADKSSLSRITSDHLPVIGVYRRGK